MRAAEVILAAPTPIRSPAPRPRRGCTPARTSTPRSPSCTPTATRRASCARRPRCPICSRSKARWTSWRYRSSMDPIELRRVNDTMKEPIERPALYQPLADGLLTTQAPRPSAGPSATPEPASMRGRRLAGRLGLRHRPAIRRISAPATARVRLQRDGRARVQIAGA